MGFQLISHNNQLTTHLHTILYQIQWLCEEYSTYSDKIMQKKLHYKNILNYYNYHYTHPAVPPRRKLAVFGIAPAGTVVLLILPVDL